MEDVLSFIADLKEVGQPAGVIQSKLLNLSDLLESHTFKDSEQALLKETLCRALLPVLRHWCGLSKEGSDLFPICSELVQNFVVPQSAEDALEVKKLAYSLFLSGKSAKARQHGLELLQCCFRKYPGEAMAVRFEIEGCVRGFLGALSQPSKSSSTVLKQVNVCLGLICECYPTIMSEFSDDILR